MDEEIALQKLPGAIGGPVSARHWRWTVVGCTTHGALRRTRVVAAEHGAPALDTFVEPFDRVLPATTRTRPRKISNGWLRWWVTSWPEVAYPAVSVAAPIDLPIDLPPHQLAPALAVVGGAGLRLLLADAVGEGKTIEAGLLIRELTRRGAADRVLILTPLSLRDQWRHELGTRCRLESVVIDRAALNARERRTPCGISSFQAPSISILSADLAKQADLLARLSAMCWDVLVIDEAHGVGHDSARAAAAAALGARARLVLLLTATPHAGDDEAFARVCEVGRLDDDTALLRFTHRSRMAPGSAPIIRDISPSRSIDERTCAAELARYIRQLDRMRSPASRLIALVLRKRALSSPAALAASLRHRLKCLRTRPDIAPHPVLPFDAAEVESDDEVQPPVLGEAGLANRQAELAAIGRALDAADRAETAWTKARTLRRLLRTTREQVLIFTEYRDTMLAVQTELSLHTSVAVLHGGMRRLERLAALHRFSAGEARVLVATDVAAEGLNLQRGCRLVVHVELPWSPARLEQRAGRVHRRGQARQVHVWRLLGDPRHEARVVAALADRLARMRKAGLAAGVTGGPPSLRATAARDDRPVGAIESDECEQLARALGRMRRLLAACDRREFQQPFRRPAGLPWRRARQHQSGLPEGVTVVCLKPATARGTRPTLVPVHVELSCRPDEPPTRWLPAIAEAAERFLDDQPSDRALTTALLRRERALLARAVDDSARLKRRWQGSLFERRVARAAEAARADVEARVDEHRRRLLELSDPPGASRPIAVLALWVR